MTVSKRYLRSRLARLPRITEHSDVWSRFVNVKPVWYVGNGDGRREARSEDFCSHGKLVCDGEHS